MTSQRLPSLFVSHGGGPCFFLKPGELFPPGTWERMGAHLRSIPADVGARPRSLLIVSAHWEADAFTIYAPERPKLLYDYYGFPPESYKLQYPAHGDPRLAGRVRELLTAAGFRSEDDADRGFDHGVFIPMLLAYPAADIPIVQLSLRAGLDPDEHLAVGRALAPLRDEGVLIVGSGMSYHNLRALGSPGSNRDSMEFDAWLNSAMTSSDPDRRDALLRNWHSAPGAHSAHPRAEHLAPLFVVAGAARGEIGRRTYSDAVFGKAVSSFQFGH